MSPELLDPEKFGQSTRKPTAESDCYALGMVVYEILSGTKPYGASISFATLRSILEGERPKRPQGEAGKLFAENIWSMVERCWKPQPKERASAKDVLWCLGGNPPTVGEADDQSDAEGSNVGYVSSVSSCSRSVLNHSSLVVGPPTEHHHSSPVMDRFSAPRKLPDRPTIHARRYYGLYITYVFLILSTNINRYLASEGLRASRRLSDRIKRKHMRPTFARVLLLASDATYFFLFFAL